MDELMQDLQYALRTLVRNRGFTVVAVLCLGVGIGVNAAVFSIVNGLLFRPLPYPEGDRLVMIQAESEQRGVSDGPVTYADLADLRSLPALESAEGFAARSVTLTGGDQPERLQATSVTPGLFRTLGVAPARGRVFAPAEAAEAGSEEVVILGHGLWQRSFGGDPAIVGRSIGLNDRTLTVIGVMPPDFRFPDADELWLPLGSNDPTDRNRRYIQAIGRLAPDATPGAAAEQLALLTGRLSAAHPGSHQEWQLRARTLRDTLVSPDAQRLMYVMLGAVTLVLLIACANVANLLLARGADREREISIRAALGAGRRRVVRQLLTESLVLALAGGVLGVLVAAWSLEAVLAIVPQDAFTMREELASWLRLELDATVLAYALAISLATGLAFGLLPALHAAGSGLQAGMRRGDPRGDGGRDGLRNALVTVEIALSAMLLIGSALLVQTFVRLQAEDAGFEPEGILSLRIVLAGDQYDPLEPKAAYFRTAADRLAALPGATAAAATSAIPADDGGGTVPILADDDVRSPDDALVATVLFSTAGLFETLGVELLAGRDFTATEVGDTTARVAILGASLARQLWPDDDPVGRRFRPANQEGGWFTVVGVAPDLQYEEFGEDTEQTRRQIHVPYAHAGYRQMAFLVRTDGSPDALIGPARAELRAIDGTLAPYDIMSLERRRAVTTWTERMFGQTFAGFGVAALLLALAGVYGVMAYAVARRRREIGIRVALGATGAAVMRLVLSRAARLTATGVALGILGGLVLARLLSTSLWGVGPSDPGTFIAVPLFLAGAALFAAWVPALRATRVSPVEAIRAE